MLKNLDILKIIIECTIALLRDVSVDLVSYNTSFQYTHCIAMSFYEMMLDIFTFYRGSRSQMFFKISVLKNFAIFTGNHLCWSLFLIKLQALRPAFLL